MSATDTEGDTMLYIYCMYTLKKSGCLQLYHLKMNVHIVMRKAKFFFYTSSAINLKHLHFLMFANMQCERIHTYSILYIGNMTNTYRNEKQEDQCGGRTVQYNERATRKDTFPTTRSNSS